MTFHCISIFVGLTCSLTLTLIHFPIRLVYIGLHSITFYLTLYSFPLLYSHSCKLHFISCHFYCVPLRSIAFHCIPSCSIAFHCIPLHSIYFSFCQFTLFYLAVQYTIYTHIHTPTHTKYMHSMPFHCIPFGSNPFRCRRTTHTRPDQTSHHTSHKDTHTHTTSIYRTQYNTTERKEATYTKYTHNTIDYSII